MRFRKNCPKQERIIVNADFWAGASRNNPGYANMIGSYYLGDSLYHANAVPYNTVLSPGDYTLLVKNFQC